MPRSKDGARAMLRHALATLAYRGGKAVRGANYYKATIEAGRVGAEQAAPKVEFD